MLRVVLFYFTFCGVKSSIFSSNAYEVQQFTQSSVEWLVKTSRPTPSRPVPKQLEECKFSQDPEESLTTPQLINYCGYPAEEHYVTTEDGFILLLHRVSGPKNSTKGRNNRPPVFVQHGLLGSSADWVLNLCKDCLPFLLADAGYDVWLGNIRGNRYSKNSTKYSPSEHEFWQYSFDEMASYDLPAMLDYVMNETNVSSIKYVGFSMGTTMMFALLSSKPEYNDKIQTFYAFAPVAKLTHTRGPLAYLAPFVHEFQFLLKVLGVDEFLPSSQFMKFIGDSVCRIAPKCACENVLFAVTGYDPGQMNATRLPVYIAHNPAGASVQTIVHYAQLINSGNFQRFDYGRNINLKKYGQATPPLYNLSAITTPVALFWGENDFLADPIDVATLASVLKNVRSYYKVPFEYFNHVDFTWAIQANTLVYQPLLKLMKYETYVYEENRN